MMQAYDVRGARVVRSCVYIPSLIAVNNGWHVGSQVGTRADGE